MSAACWDGHGPILADTSAWTVARNVAPARELLLAAVERDDVAWCWPVRYELTIDARNADGIARVDRTFEGMREVAVDRGVQRGVLAAMRELASAGSHGAHRYPLTDLTVAIAAQKSGLAVLHHDSHFDRLAPLIGIQTHWIADPAITSS